MKRSVIILATIAIIFLSWGYAFKWLHLPGASLFVIPGGLVALVATVLAMIEWLKKPGCKCTKWITFITLLVTVVGIVFKRMYYPGGTMMCVIDFGLLIPITTILLGIYAARKGNTKCE